MTPKEFREQIEAISYDSGDLYGRLSPLLAAETAHNHAASGFTGFAALVAGSRCFFLETVNLANVEIRPKVSKPLSDQYPLFLERVVQYFHSLRAAEIVATQGYPMHAYTLLRNLFDSAILASAAAQGITDFLKLEGIDPAKAFDPKSFRKARRKEEDAVRPVMTGKKSDLSEKTLDALNKWDVLFDDETHGSLLSRAQKADWLKGKANLGVVPKFSEMPYGMFLNRYCEIGWMVHRLLPLIQPNGVPFSAEWKRKWGILDHCFHISVESVSTQMGKAIGHAIVELVQKKFPYNQDSHFWS